MGTKYLWFLGKESGEVIQGQAGKPFYHQRGPWVKFGDTKEKAQQAQAVDNSCLCLYPYMRYFYIYAAVDSDKKRQGLLQQQFLTKALDQSWYPDYTIRDKSYFCWTILGGYQYAGCMPKTQTGVWQQVDMFNYGQACQNNDDKYPIQNVSFPSYTYLGTKDSSPPFQTVTGAASLWRMLVCSYKCCNGVKGCGIEVDQQSSANGWNCPPGGQFCQAWFTVYWTYVEGRPTHYDIVSEPYDAVCGQCYQQDKTTILSCTSAAVRRHGQRMKLDETELQSCSVCLQRLRKAILNNQPPPDVSCAIFRLYEYPQDGQTCTFMDPVLIETTDQWATIPSQIAQGGDGCRIVQGHQTGDRIICRPGSVYGVRGFTWVRSQNCVQEPDPPSSLTGQSTIGLQCTCQDISKQEQIDEGQHAQNNGRDQLKDPCNEPDPPPYMYQEFQYTYFDVYKLPLTQDKDSSQQDDCVSHYSFPTDADGNPEWRLVQSGKKDYQLKNSTLFVKLQKRIYIDENEASYYRVVRQGCKPEIDDDDKSSLGDNLIQNPYSECPVYFMVTWDPDRQCSEQNLAEPASSGDCTIWVRLGPMSKSMLAKNYMFVDVWVPVITEQDGGVRIGYRYIHGTDPGTQSYCEDPPELPGYDNFVRLHYVVYQWEQQCQDGCPTQVTPPESYELQELRAVADAYPDDTSGEVQDSVPCRMAGGLAFDIVGPQQGQDPNFHPALYAYPILQPGGLYAQVLTCEDQYEYQVVGEEDGKYTNNTISCQPTLAVVEAHDVFTPSSDLYFFLQAGANQPVVFSQTQVQFIEHNGIKYQATWHVLPSQAEVKKQFQNIQVTYAYASACCGDKSYYVTTQDALDQDLFAIQGGACYECQEDDIVYSHFSYVGMGFTQAMQAYLGTDQWIYKAAVSQAANATFHYMVGIDSEDSGCDELGKDPAQTPPDIILLAYELRSWQPDCDNFQGDNPATVPPEGYLAEVVQQSISPKDFDEARAMLAGTGSQNGFYLQNGEQKWELQKPWPAGGAMYGFGQESGANSYQYIQGSGDTYQMPMDMCQAVYIQPILKCFANPNPKVYKIDAGSLYWSGNSTRRIGLDGSDITVPMFYSLSSNIQQEIDEQFEVDGECQGETVTFVVHFIPKKKKIQAAQKFNVVFDIFCCDAHYYYAYVLRYDSSSCSFKMPSTTPVLSRACSTQWTSLGLMRQGAFYQKYYGKEGWIPFTGSQSSPFGQSSAVVWIAESDEPPEEFCQSAPDMSGASAPYVVYYQVDDWTAKCAQTGDVEVEWPDLDADKKTYDLVGSNKTASRAYLYYLGKGSVVAPTKDTFLGSGTQVSTCPAQFAPPIPGSGLYTVTLADKTANCAGTAKTSWALVSLKCESAAADPTSCKIYGFRTSITVPGSNAKSVLKGQFYSANGKVTVVKFGSVDQITYSEQEQDVNGYIVKYTLMTVPSSVELTEFQSCAVSFPQACVDVEEVRAVHFIKVCTSYDSKVSQYAVSVTRDDVGNICSLIPSGFYTSEKPTFNTSKQSYSDALVPVVNGVVTPDNCDTIYYIESLFVICAGAKHDLKTYLQEYKTIDWSKCRYITYFYFRVSQCTQPPTSCSYSQGSKYDIQQWYNDMGHTLSPFWGTSVWDQLQVIDNVVQAGIASRVFYVVPMMACGDEQLKAPTSCPSGVTIAWDETKCKQITVYYLLFAQCKQPTSSCTFIKGSTYTYTDLTATSWWSSSSALTGARLTVSNNVVQPGSATTVYYVVAVVHDIGVNPKAPTSCPSGVTIAWGSKEYYAVYATKVAKCDQPSASCTFSLVTSTATSVTASSWWSASRSATGTALNVISAGIFNPGSTSDLGCISASAVSGPVYYLVAKKYKYCNGVPANWASCPSSACIHWGNNCDDDDDDDSDATETSGCAQLFMQKCSLGTCKITASVSNASLEYVHSDCKSKTKISGISSVQLSPLVYDVRGAILSGNSTTTNSGCQSNNGTYTSSGDVGDVGVSSLYTKNGSLYCAVYIQFYSTMFSVGSAEFELTCSGSSSPLRATGSHTLSDTTKYADDYTQTVTARLSLTFTCTY